MSFCSHWQSCTSLLRPGTYFTCRASTRHTFKPRLSNTSYTGIQYPPSGLQRHPIDPAGE
jgi:hypothetical protein